jgi:hypothetical protein
MRTDPETQKAPTPKLVYRFWKYTRSGDGCWEWTGALSKAGYGVLSFQRRTVYAHRLSYEIHFGPIPEGRLVCHHCDNPACVNPSHLYAGTERDNARDMVNRGRDRHVIPPVSERARGEVHVRSKLTEVSVLEIRNRFAAGENAVSLAREFGMTKSGIAQVTRGITWKHVGGPVLRLTQADGLLRRVHHAD